MAEIDSLQIKIEADSENAAQGVRSLASALEQLAGADYSSAAENLQGFARSISEFKGNLKIPKGFAASAGQLKTIMGSVAAIKVPDNISGLESAANALTAFSQGISGFSLNKGFGTSVARMGEAIKSLESAGNGEKFMQTVANLEYSMKRLNEIDLGNNWATIIQVISSISHAASNAESFNIGGGFVRSITNIATAAERLNEVDWTGMRTMQDVMKNMPENVKISFGSDTERPDFSGISQSAENAAHAMEAMSNAMREVQESESNLQAQTQATQEELTGADALGARIWDGVTGALNKFRVPLSESAIWQTTVKGAGAAIKGIGTYAKAIVSPITAAGNAIRSITGKIGQFAKSLKRIAFYRIIRSILKTITEGLAEGRQNLYQYSLVAGTDFAKSMDTAATAALYLKNSIGAATAPITNWFVPILDRAIDRIVELVNRFNELTASLTGAATWTKAIKYPIQWGEAADDATKAAKKMRSVMLGFDELNVIEPTSTASGSKAADALDYSKMFQEMQTNFSLNDKLKSAVVPIQLAWSAEGEYTLNQLRETWESILSLVGAVGRSFSEVWQNGTGQRTLELTLQIIQAISGTVGGIATNFRKAWETAGKGTKIIQSLWNIGNNILTVFRDIWLYIREWAEGLDFNPLLSGLGNLFSAVDQFTNPQSGAARFLKDILNDILLPIGKWIIEVGVPKMLDFAAAIIRLADTVIDTLYPAWKWISENLLKPGGTMIGSTIEVIITALTDLVNIIDKFARGDFDFSDSFLVGFGSEIKTGGEQGFLDLWESGFKSMFGDGSVFDADWTNPMKGFGESVYDLFHPQEEEKETVLLEYRSMTDSLVQASNDCVESIRNLWNGYKEDWANGFEEMRKTASQKWESVKKSLKDGWNGLKEKVVTFKNDWNTYFSEIGQKAYDKWQSVKDDWTNGWAALKEKATDFKDTTIEKFKNLRDEISKKWDGVKSDISTGWETIKETFRSGIIKAKNAMFETEAYKKITGFVDSFKKDWETGLDSLMKPFRDFVDNVKKKFEEIWGDENGGLKKVLNDIRNGIREPLNGVISSIESMWNHIASGINYYIGKLNQSLSFDVPDWIPGIGGKSFSLNVPEIPAVSFYKLAEGGIPDTGQVFIAREQGAELVGRYGNRTGVMNNDQIVESVTAGVYSAVVSALQNLPRNDENPSFNLFIDGREVTASVERTQQSKGRQIFTGGVYV